MLLPLLSRWRRFLFPQSQGVSHSFLGPSSRAIVRMIFDDYCVGGLRLGECCVASMMHLCLACYRSW